MNDRQDSSDRMMDRNLRTLARCMSLPDEPSEEQQAQWTQSPKPERLVPFRQGVRFVKNHRALTFAGAGSALAATIAIVVTLFAPMPGTTVDAATILASLQEAMDDAFKVTYQDIGHPLIDGVKADMEAVFIIEPGGENDEAADRTISALHFDAHVQVNEAFPLLAGLDYDVEGAFTEERWWMYARVNEVPEKLLESSPISETHLEQCKNGVLIDMGVLMDALQSHDWEEHLHAQTAAVLGIEDRRKAANMLHHGLQALSQHLSKDHTLGDMHHGEVGGLFNGLLTGQASPDEFEQLAGLLQGEAGQVEVSRQADGAYLLEAKDFSPHAEDLGPAMQAYFERTTLRIAYSEDAGLLWAAVDHVGPHDGYIRLERTEVAPDDPMFSDQRFREDRVTTVMDLSMTHELLSGNENGE
jgi:hypothetical protein